MPHQVCKTVSKAPLVGRPAKFKPTEKSEERPDKEHIATSIGRRYDTQSQEESGNKSNTYLIYDFVYFYLFILFFFFLQNSVTVTLRKASAVPIITYVDEHAKDACDT